MVTPYVTQEQFDRVFPATTGQAEEQDEGECEACCGTGKVLIYGIEESWEEECQRCLPPIEAQGVEK
jgi:hypothetical protein